MSELQVQDVLNPKKVWLGNSCYRVNRKRTDAPIRKINTALPKTTYNDNEGIRCDEYNDTEVEVTENGRFKTSIRLPQEFYSYIIGTRGSRRKRLEDETKTDISIPRQANNNKIIITGPTERNVIACKCRLEMIGNELRNKHCATHFISYPVVSDGIKNNFKKFKELILAEGHIDGVSETIFKNVDKLHLTIGMLVLLDDCEKNEAAQILEECKKEIIIPQLASCEPLNIKVKGLDYMNDDPAQVHVLYAKVQIENNENPNILQKLSDDIVEFFTSKGKMKKESDYVKLHVTLMNTRYRKDSDADESGSRSRDRKRHNKRISFDARPILDKFNDFDFGYQQLDYIHLSERFSVDKDGYYEPIHKISCK